MRTPNTQEIEAYLQHIIFPELDRGRPDWDKPHTIAVVYYLKEIISHAADLSLDSPVLLIAAYAHDWGYAGLFVKRDVLTLKEILAVKELHMKIGVEKVSALLKDDFFSFLKTQQKIRVIRLVGVHDKLRQLKNTDELILMEADTLGALDTDYIKPFSDTDSSDRYLHGVENKRLPLFITDYGKKKVEELIQKRERYYKNLLSKL